MEPEISLSRMSRPRRPIDRPFVVGAVDAGSNAMRAAVALVSPGAAPRIMNRLRIPVRLGREVFTSEHLAAGTLERAVAGFAKFRAMFDDYGATHVRAVGTSAVREARDRHRLIDAVRAATGLSLQPIEGAEEARLVRTAVLRAFPLESPPELIADLGGGSLELSILYRGEMVTSVILPLGTVRLLETLGLEGALAPGASASLRLRVLGALRAAVACTPGPGARVALCGGNARTLARLFPGEDALGLATLDVRAMTTALPAVCTLDVEQRIAAYGVGRDRAEVMAIAAVVIAAMAEWMSASTITVPGVGVLDGLVHELATCGIPRAVSW